MQSVFLESGVVSLTKHDEMLCGDCYQTVGDENATTVVLADGLGSGVKANILSTLTSQILSTMMASRMPIEQCVTTIAQTLPVCKVRNLAYSTFTLLQVERNFEAYLAQFDNPEAILLRGGKNVDYPITQRIIGGKKIGESRLKLQVGDVLVLITDGVTHAGLGKCLPMGWDRKEVIEYIEECYTPDLSAKGLAAQVAAACRDLYVQEFDDDTTILVLKVRERRVVNLLIGPPQKWEDDEKVCRLFFAREGEKIVCGGSTATMVADYLKKPLLMDDDYVESDVPPTARIEGVDLVTEGVVTMSRVVELARQFCATDLVEYKWGRDGASRIAQILFEKATDINFFVGMAVNPSHQNPDLKIDFTIKMTLVKELEECLKKMGKNVKMSTF